MKLMEILQGRDALTRLTDTHFKSYKLIRELALLKKRADEEFAFYTEQEKRIVNTYADRDEKGQIIFLDGGRVKLKDAEAKAAFESEIGKLNDTEIDDMPVVTVLETDFASASDFPTATEMLLLSELVDFKEA